MVQLSVPDLLGCIEWPTASEADAEPEPFERVCQDLRQLICEECLDAEQRLRMKATEMYGYFKGLYRRDKEMERKTNGMHKKPDFKLYDRMWNGSKQNPFHRELFVASMRLLILLIKLFLCISY